MSGIVLVIGLTLLGLGWISIMAFTTGKDKNDDEHLY